jgi:hypothetical protein
LKDTGDNPPVTSRLQDRFSNLRHYFTRRKIGLGIFCQT